MPSLFKTVIDVVAARVRAKQVVLERVQLRRVAERLF